MKSETKTAKKTKTAKPAKSKTKAPKDDEAPKSKSIVPVTYKKKYGKSQSCGDELSDVLKEELTDQKTKKTSSAALVKVGKQNDIDVSGKWGGLNIGQQRMNLGNVLRNRLKRGEYVQVGSQAWNKDQKGKKAA